MTRYQACRALGIGPAGSALITFTHWFLDAPEGRVAVLHMIINYDPGAKYERGMKLYLDKK